MGQKDNRTSPAVLAFFNFIQDFQTSPENTPCVTFDGSRTKEGYGCILIKGKGRKAHRIAWEGVNGPIPAGLKVLHKCDNPPCFNPDHLFLGTDKDNSDDKIAKGRDRPQRGEDHGMHKLSVKEVKAIREQRLAGATLRGLAKKFGVSKGNICFIVTGKTWKRVN